MNGPAVEARGLTVRFSGFTAVNNVSFRVERGEIFGFLGANGAGKTTTIRVLCGLLAPTEGEVRIAGLSFEDGEQRIKSKVGYMSQKFTLYDDMTIDENLIFASNLRKLQNDFFCAQRDMLFDFISFDRSMLKTKVADLPSGVKQQVSLIASLLHDPEIVFLDEPTAGVTPASRARFWHLIRKIAERKKTVFVTTHYMDEAEQCGRIALMRSGHLIALDSPSALKKAAFPSPMYEFEPKGTLSFSEISQLKVNPAFSFFEPYGIRFHATIGSEGAWEKAQDELKNSFTIRNIEPTLEDVFIHIVEGKQ